VVYLLQAEAGIRDATVTGVQTCALPICDDRAKGPDRPETWSGHAVREPYSHRVASGSSKPGRTGSPCMVSCFRSVLGPALSSPRSEERRVGKECRARGSVEW